ncbi:peptidoglycan-binding domain-containing protein [Nannocystis pusilla]|uniref:Peptidoglycan-binding domain-containing protein n=1 Tax=Nannocystis pusilla TaxID=889268 RepID=A0A9X3J5A5_9BACT|nr:peptidoglycan-binding domain-containing protein [Nannocystis pusilla]
MEGEGLPAQGDDTGADGDPFVGDLADAPELGPVVGDRGEKVARAHAYLKQYGYFPNAALERLPGWKPVLDHEPEDPEVFDEVLEEAVSRFQAAHGLVVDGTLNAETQRLMAAPRCGIPDYYELPRPRQGSSQLCTRLHLGLEPGPLPLPQLHRRSRPGGRARGDRGGVRPLGRGDQPALLRGGRRRHRDQLRRRQPRRQSAVRRRERGARPRLAAGERALGDVHFDEDRPGTSAAATG